MEIKEILEMIIQYGSAPVIMGIFLINYTKMMNESTKKQREDNKQVLQQMEKSVEKLNGLYMNDTKMENLVTSLIVSVEKLTSATETVASVVDRMDIYNKESTKKLDSHDTRSETILRNSELVLQNTERILNKIGG